MESFPETHQLPPMNKVPTSVRLCGRYMRALPWICLPMLVTGISIFILSHHYPGSVPSPELLTALQTAGPVILGLTVVLLVVGIAGSCHVGTYLLERRETEMGDEHTYLDEKQHGGAYPVEEEKGGT
ncbi:uncharacterized protein LOC122363841 [Amphibalanus amphitrite]|uniref:uncharacterized protein LOC122363841 n=1 Tax=Amphibalanus amphitrite TaxID=1232801 RepID=UPI001C920571|nr:uncharacterized protein LOC122363841 [Amphibalanus amphitrite]